MKKRILSLGIFLLCTLCAVAQPRAKYVFYFIGDGMGVNQVNGAETYLAAMADSIGFFPMCFSSFPYVALVNTYSATNGVTDSAAGGTALATGKKTKNGAIGVLKDLETPAKSIAYNAQEHGAAVGIATNVSVDHATPASFYAHAASRHQYYEIGKQLGPTGFDFFGGSDFQKPNAKADEPDLYEQTRAAGYTIVRGYPEYLANRSKADRIVLFQTEEDSKAYRYTIPYKIERKAYNLSAVDITRAGLDFLYNKKKDGFFFMMEGGMIDMACHNNDGPAYIHEMLDFDSCIQVAYDFYMKHPDETLIVITADHETGGLSLGRGPYELRMQKLAVPKASIFQYGRRLRELAKEQGSALTEDALMADAAEHFGFGHGIELTQEQERQLRSAARKVAEVAAQPDAEDSALANACSAFAGAINRTTSEQALIGWQSGGHSNGYVPAFAIGVGADQFHGRINNTQISQFILKAAGWE